MNAVSIGSDGDIRARIDQKSGSQFPVLSSQFEDDARCFARQTFEFAGSEILLAELDVIDAMTRSFGDLVEEALAASVLVPGEGETVSNVVEEQGFSLSEQGDHAQA